MKSNYWKFIFKILIVVLIVFTLLPSSAFAEKIRVRLKNFDGIEEISIKKVDGEGGEDLLEIEGKRYRGNIVREISGSEIYWVNKLDFTDYLYGVLPGEMPPSWHEEALKAQAVCARTFAKRQMLENKDLPYDLVDRTSSQVYLGYDGENDKTKKAVDETAGLYLKYNGDYIEAVYHSNSGGHTADSESIWSSKVDYLRGIDDPYSIGMPKSSWEFELDRYEFSNILDEKGYRVGRIKSIKTRDISKDGRVRSLEISGDAGIQVLNKEKIRQILGYEQMKSIWYSVYSDAPIYVLDFKKGRTEAVEIENSYSIEANDEIDNLNEEVFILSLDGKKKIQSLGEKVLFKGKGYGHGVGLSQWGAKNMAELGFDFEEILKFYYRNVDLMSEE